MVQIFRFILFPFFSYIFFFVNNLLIICVWWTATELEEQENTKRLQLIDKLALRMHFVWIQWWKIYSDRWPECLIQSAHCSMFNVQWPLLKPTSINDEFQLTNLLIIMRLRFLACCSIYTIKIIILSGSTTSHCRFHVHVNVRPFDSNRFDLCSREITIFGIINKHLIWNRLNFCSEKKTEKRGKKP